MTNLTKFVTPPDFVDDENINILIIDADPIDIETLSFICASHSKSFNVYLYRESYGELSWLIQAAAKAETIIINTVENSLSGLKDALANKETSFHYGPKTYPNNKRRYSSALEYFKQNH